MRNALLSTLNHVIELAACLIAAVCISRFFDLGNDQTGLVAGVVVNALMKFSRTTGALPDYANKE